MMIKSVFDCLLLLHPDNITNRKSVEIRFTCFISVVFLFTKSSFVLIDVINYHNRITILFKFHYFAGISLKIPASHSS